MYLIIWNNKWSLS